MIQLYLNPIGLRSFKAKIINEAYLIIIDEVSMLTVKAANKIDFTLRFLYKGEELNREDIKEIEPFGGKNILFVGDLLQLPPGVPNNRSYKN